MKAQKTQNYNQYPNRKTKLEEQKKDPLFYITCLAVHFIFLRFAIQFYKRFLRKGFFYPLDPDLDPDLDPNEAQADTIIGPATLVSQLRLWSSADFFILFLIKKQQQNVY